MMTDISSSPRFDLEQAVRGGRTLARSPAPNWSSVERRVGRDQSLFTLAMVLALMLVGLAVWECVMLRLSFRHPGNAIDQLLASYLPEGSSTPSGGAYLPLMKFLPSAIREHVLSVLFPVLAAFALARRNTAGFVFSAGMSLLSWRVVGWWVFPVADENGVLMAPNLAEELLSFGRQPAWWFVSHTGRALLELMLSGTLVVVLGKLLALDDGGSFKPLRYRWSLLGSATAFAFGLGLHLGSVVRWLSRFHDGQFLDLVAIVDFTVLDLLPMLLCTVTFIGIVRLRTWSLLTGMMACIASLAVPIALPLVSYGHVDADYILPPLANFALLVALTPLFWTFVAAFRSSAPARNPG